MPNATDGLLEIRLAHALKAARKARGLTVAEAVRAAHCAHSHWDRMEQAGSVGNMQLLTLQRMAAALGLRLDIKLSVLPKHAPFRPQPNDTHSVPDREEQSA